MYDVICKHSEEHLEVGASEEWIRIGYGEESK